MTEPSTDAWFSGVEPGDVTEGARRIVVGRTTEPAAWPSLAVDTGFVDDETAYYEILHESALEAARREVAVREGADDRQLVHAIRASDDVERVANELAERVTEWAGAVFDEAGRGVDGALDLAEREPEGPIELRVIELARRVADLLDERDRLRAFVEDGMPAVAPNLSALAGPILGARLIALAGGLEPLAKKPSGTIQVLGAEEALFAHLRGHAPSPKHGIIFTHEYVRGTRPEERGSAARALAGKLAIAARIDHYAGDLRPELEDELDERVRRIRERRAGK